MKAHKGPSRPPFQAIYQIYRIIGYTKWFNTFNWNERLLDRSFEQVYQVAGPMSIWKLRKKYEFQLKGKKSQKKNWLIQQFDNFELSFNK